MLILKYFCKTPFAVINPEMRYCGRLRLTAGRSIPSLIPFQDAPAEGCNSYKDGFGSRDICPVGEARYGSGRITGHSERAGHWIPSDFTA